MKYFIDTEFNERGSKHPLELISIGIVAEDGRELYCVNSLFDSSHANSWVKEHVLPLLPERRPERLEYGGSPRLNLEAAVWSRRAVMVRRILDFVGDDPLPEFWGYYCAYDWVVLCQLFGDMSRLPTGWPMYCHDLRQAMDAMGHQDVRQSDDAPHNALENARWIAQMQQWFAIVYPPVSGKSA